MDFEKPTSWWLSNCKTSDISAILWISLKYMESSRNKYAKNQLLELGKVCYEMTAFVRDEMMKKQVCRAIGILSYDVSRFTDSLRYHMESLRICQDTGDVPGEGKSYGSIGNVYDALGQYKKALEYYKKYLRICQDTGDLPGEGKSYGSIGYVYNSLGQYKEALEYYNKHLRICQDTGDLPGTGTSYCNMSNVYLSLGQYEKAIEYSKKHLSICQATDDLDGKGYSYGIIGNVNHSTGKYDKAMEYHKKRLYICQETCNVVGEGTCYCDIGNVYNSLGQCDKAMEYHEKHLRICRKTSDLAGEGKSYGNIGNVYQSLGQYEKALEYLNKCLHICQETGNLAERGKSYSNIGNVYSLQGHYEKAKEYYTESLRISQDIGALAQEGSSYCNIGNVYHSLGESKKAMEYLQKSLCISQDTGDLAGEGASYSNIGRVYASQGQYDKAMEYYEKNLRICQDTGDIPGQGKAYNNIATVCSSLGQYEKAMKCLNECLRLCQETGDLACEGAAYSYIGDVYHSLGKNEKAIQYHKKQLRISQDAKDLAGEGKSYCNTGIVHQSLGQYEEALECHKKHLRICQQTRDVAGEGKSYCNIGIVCQSRGQYEEAMEYQKKYLYICQKTSDLAGKGMAYRNIGNVFHLLRQYDEAMKYYMKDLSICKEIGDLASEGKAYSNIGNDFFMNDDLQGAESNLRESLGCFEKLFKSLHHQDDYKVSIVDTYIQAYHMLTDVLLASGKQEEAFLVSERGRSQALRDKLLIKYGVPKDEKGRELSIEDIDSLVNCSDSSVLFLSLARNKLSIFLKEQGKELCLRESKLESFVFCGKNDCSRTMSQDLVDTLKSYVNKIIQDANDHLSASPNNSCEDRSMDIVQDKYHDQELRLSDPVSVDEVADGTKTRDEDLEETTTTSLSNYRGTPTEHSDEGSAISKPQNEQTQTKYNLFNDLYRVLVAPVQHALTKPEIVIIPDGPLFFVPFAALKDKDQPFLSETKRIRIGPSLTTLKLLKECPVGKHCKTGALIVGGPIAGVVMFRGKKMQFSDLPFAREEALMIGDILGESPLTGSSATKDEVRKRLQEGVGIIHIATHGDAATGELLLAPGSRVGKEIPEEEDYMLTMKDIYSCGINAQLVVLSCCHSGRGEIKAEGVVGLTRAFLAVGARSVLASLWAVNDAATSYFMRHFYQNLKSGESACASLQQAMTEMRKTREWSHPYYWAPFFIVGDDITITFKQGT